MICIDCRRQGWHWVEWGGDTQAWREHCEDLPPRQVSYASRLHWANRGERNRMPIPDWAPEAKWWRRLRYRFTTRKEA